MKSQHFLRVLSVAIALVAAIAFVRTFAQARKGQHGAEQKSHAQEESTPLVRMENGRTVIRLSAQEQSQAGIEAEKLKPAREREQLAVPAVVPGVQSLVTMASSYATAQANLVTAQNKLSVSQPEYQRLKSLYTNQNVSGKDFQAAEGSFHNDQASVAAARQEVAYQLAALRQNWGNRIAQWVAENPSSLGRVLNRQDVLVQVTLPTEGPATAPGEVSLELPNQGSVTAKLVSRFPQVDPRIQGPGFLYVTSAQGTLAPGLNVVAHLSYGPRLKGVIVPSSAIIWWQGEPWVYVETASGQFTHKAVQSDHPVAGGFFCATGFKPGEKVVVQGAEQILAIELNPSPQPSSGGEGDDN
jgi:hypothetical protein